MEPYMIHLLAITRKHQNYQYKRLCRRLELIPFIDKIMLSLINFVFSFPMKMFEENYIYLLFNAGFTYKDYF